MGKLKVHVLVNDGSPVGVTLKDLYGEGNRGIGVGGAEHSLLTMCEEWHKRGDDVCLYNNPMTPNGSPFEQRKINDFDPNEDRDILIVFRSPNPRAISAKGLRCWWSCDQYTIGDFKQFSGYMHKIVGISPFHKQHFQNTYQINNMIVIDLPIRIQDILDAPQPERVPNRLIFTSVPDRGLKNLWRYWPQISKRCPEATLVITSDYRLWGVGELNGDHKISWMHVNNVQFLGAIARRSLIQEELKADIHVYPNEYDELFCISNAEAQCAGAYPVTSNVGALATTNMGKIIPGNPKDGVNYSQAFIDGLLSVLSNRDQLEKDRIENMQKARERFNPKRILEQWDTLVFGEKSCA